MLPRSLTAAAILVTCALASCTEEADPRGVVVEVRYADAWDEAEGEPGGPVAGADVEIVEWIDPDDPVAGTNELASGTADANGVLVVESIEPGDVIIRAGESGELGPADCLGAGSIEVTLRDEGETVTVELDHLVCS